MASIPSLNSLTSESTVSTELIAQTTVSYPHVSPLPNSSTGATDLGPSTQPLFYPMALHKLAVMSVCTFGLYELYWFYRNWKLLRDNGRFNVSPFWRMFFHNLFAYSLFQHVRRQAENASVSVSCNAAVLALWYVACSVFAPSLPVPLSLLAWFTFVPLLQVQRTINAINDASASPVTSDNSYSARNVAVIVLGVLVLILALIGTFSPPPVPKGYEL